MIKQPLIKESELELLGDFSEFAEENEGFDVSNKKISLCAIGEKLADCSFENCVFEGCRMNETDFAGCAFKNVIFQRCDFSNCNFSNAYFNRCSLSDVKAVGISLPNAALKDVSFNRCNLEMCDLRTSELHRCNFNDVNMTAAIVSDAKLKEVELKDVKLINACFFKTKLAGLDFTKSDISGVQVSSDGSELKGARVDVYQATMFAKLFGLEIEE